LHKEALGTVGTRLMSEGIGNDSLNDIVNQVDAHSLAVAINQFEGVSPAFQAFAPPFHTIMLEKRD